VIPFFPFSYFMAMVIAESKAKYSIRASGVGCRFRRRLKNCRSDRKVKNPGPEDQVFNVAIKKNMSPPSSQRNAEGILIHLFLISAVIEVVTRMLAGNCIVISRRFLQAKPLAVKLPV
jgi:hypothetical protein